MWGGGKEVTVENGKTERDLKRRRRKETRKEDKVKTTGII
jgi:hypothetical protein